MKDKAIGRARAEIVGDSLEVTLTLNSSVDWMKIVKYLHREGIRTYIVYDTESQRER